MKSIFGGARACLARALALCLFLSFLVGVSSVAGAQQSLGTLRGQVVDTFGGVIIGATVTATDAAGVERTATTDDEGRYAIAGLAPGRYTVRASSPGFDQYENTEVEVTAGDASRLDVLLNVAVTEEEITVTAEAPVSSDPESNAGAIVLRGEDLDALPDDPDDLSEALQALAGPSAGAEGEAQIFLDGFSGGRLPPKESIREIRINRNPFSAEYDRLGYGRVEIFTKPGTDRLRGQTFFNFTDESLNSRSPFARERAPYQSRRYGGNLSGPIIEKKASFFFDFERRETDDNAVVNAIVLDSALNPVEFNESILTPVRRTTFSPRLDWQLNPTNTLVFRYTYERANRINEGVGGFNLPERAFDSESTQQTIQLTETAVINQRVINETRFQYTRERRRQEGGTLAPTIRVNEAFTSGGAQVGLSRDDEDRFELHNQTSWAVGNHSLKAGARLRHARITDVSQQNFAGTFTFATLEQYRATLAGEEGARPTQFSITGGDPVARISVTDFSPFVQDDWRARPDLTLSAGLRYDVQRNIDSALNFAPRLAFAWAPGAGGAQGQQKTVIRGGFGVFYDRFNEGLLLQSERFSGGGTQQFLVTSTTEGGAAALDLFPVVPTIAQLEAFSVPQTLRRMAGDLRTPYTLQTALSFERQLPYRTSLSVSLIAARTLHVLRSRNVNAPLPGTGARPLAGVGNVFQYESSGRFNQQQLIVNFNNRFSRRYSFSANYIWNRARSDTDGPNTFPVNQYDLSGEYGRSLQDIRHRFTLFGTINALPWGVRLNPIFIATSGRPFNITVGRDLNGDALFTERPAFATDLADAGVRVTPFGAFDVTPSPGQQIIPRNFGTGPSFFNLNLRASKTIGFGDVVEGGGGGGGGRGGGGRRGGGGGGGRRGGGGRGGRGGGEGGEAVNRRYGLTFSVNVQNLLNSTNEGTPVGNLSSPLFGQSVTTAGRFGRGGGGGGGDTAGNRRVELQLRFSF
ncbi:MAG TPA: carboxypeptidase regulatory-like domain-containing protein [Pyrinomonadaceae bacterium]|nr:carboxypeptidase regulatory-like domain-containing protein [Pyrinomonadaceae bacterium]